MVYNAKGDGFGYRKVDFTPSSSTPVALGKILGHSFFIFKVRVLRLDEF